MIKKNIEIMFFLIYKAAADFTVNFPNTTTLRDFLRRAFWRPKNLFKYRNLPINYMEKMQQPKTWEEFVDKYRDVFEQIAKTPHKKDEYN